MLHELLHLSGMRGLERNDASKPYMGTITESTGSAWAGAPEAPLFEAYWHESEGIYKETYLIDVIIGPDQWIHQPSTLDPTTIPSAYEEFFGANR